MKLANIFYVLALLLFAATAFGQTKPIVVKPSPYVGYKYAGVVPETVLPNGVKHLGGGLVGDIDADPVYGISLLKKGTTQMLWLEVSTGRDSTGVTGWRVKDVLTFPGLAKTDYLYFISDPAVGCTRDGKIIENLVGVGRLIRRQAIFRPTKLWLTDLKKEKFEPMATARVKCTYSEP